MMTRYTERLGRFRKQQDGNATIEFVILFPALMSLFLMGFEAGYYMVRNVMLERAVDISVRDVRLAMGGVPDFDALKQRICDEALILPDCVNSLQVEMQPVPAGPDGISEMRQPVRCIDKESNVDPADGTTYNSGGSNQLMLLRVCALSQPLFPTTGIGVGMRADGQGNYAIVATSSFVNEPGPRTIASGSSGGVSGGTN